MASTYIRIRTTITGQMKLPFIRTMVFILAGLVAMPPATNFPRASEQLSEYGPATTVINQLHDALIYVMQNSEAMGYKGRYDNLEPVISSNFDTPLIAKVILSRYWENLDETQKSDFVELYNRLIIATYASRFKGYDGEEFRYLTTEELNRGRLLVRTELIRPNDTPVKLDYLMNRKDDEWMIISVIANGANDLSIRRGEYADVIKLRSYDALLDEIRSKIDDMENQI